MKKTNRISFLLFIFLLAALFNLYGQAGVTWTSRTSAADNQWSSITYGNGLFVAVASSGFGSGDRVMTSPDGITWSLATSAANSSWACITYGNGLFVALAGSQVMTSPDGITWSLSTSGQSRGWTSVTYGNGLFVAVAINGTGNRVMTSPDGITWTSRTSAADNTWRSVTYGNGLFVAVAESGTGNRVMTSPDGITWTSRTSAANNTWRSVTYGNGLFVAVAQSGTGNRVMTSGVVCPSSAGALSGTQAICESSATTLTSSVSGGSWQTLSSNIATIDASGVVTGQSAGSTTITYSVGGSGGCATETTTMVITVTAPPNAGTITAPSVICIGSTSQFTSSGSNGTWSSSSASVISITSSGLASGIDGGTATITFTATGTGGCLDVPASPVSVRVYNKPTFDATSLTLCREATYFITVSAEQPATNGWQSSGTASLTLNNGYLTGGSSDATGLVVSYIDACSQTASATVVITATSSVPILTSSQVAFKFDGNPQGPLLPGSTINYVGYDGYTYIGQTQPAAVGFYKANLQEVTGSGASAVGSAGCPTRFYIFNCTTCNN